MKGKKREPNPISTSNERYDAAGLKKEEFKEVYFDVQKSDASFREQDSEINLESLITAPMVAVSKANATMLSGQVKFILDFCFKKTTYSFNTSDATMNKECYEAVMVNLVVQRPNLEEGENTIKATSKEAIIPIPILTLLPINSLGIDKMKVDFSMDITSISSSKDQTSNPQERKAQLSGKLTGEKKDKDGQQLTSAKSLSVYVEASKLPLPGGLLNIIDLYSKI